MTALFDESRISSILQSHGIGCIIADGIAKEIVVNKPEANGSVVELISEAIADDLGTDCDASARRVLSALSDAGLAVHETWRPVETVICDDRLALALDRTGAAHIWDFDHDSDPAWHRERGITHWMPIPDFVHYPSQLEQTDE